MSIQFNWVGRNMWYPILLFQTCYMFGYTFRVFQQYFFQLKNLISPPGGGAVFLLLFSMLSPFITYWG